MGHSGRERGLDSRPTTATDARVGVFDFDPTRLARRLGNIVEPDVPITVVSKSTHGLDVTRNRI